jgi:hypothetical protein
MTIVIDRDYFKGIDVSNEKIDRIINAYPDCIIVNQKKEFNTNHHLAWYVGMVVLTSEKFELGSWVYFQDVRYIVESHGVDCGYIIDGNDVYLTIPSVTGSDSTNEEFFNLTFFKKKRIYESEKDLPYELIWALDRVAYLRKKRFSTINACRRVSEQSGIEYDTIYNHFCKRAIHSRWAKKDYEKRETNQIIPIL